MTVIGSKKGPTPAEEFADFLHVCQVRISFKVERSYSMLVKMRPIPQGGLVVACIAGLIGSFALLFLLCNR